MKYSRTNYSTLEIVNGIAERDLVNSKFNDYSFKYPYKQYRLSYQDYMRPDIISYKLFGVSDYWWIILKCNPEIEDIWNDVAVEEEQEDKYPDAIRINEFINIPDKRDIDEFYSFVRNVR